MSKQSEVRSGTRPALEVPEEYRNHPLLHAGPFFTLPRQLMEEVDLAIGPACLDPNLHRMELALSQQCGDHTARIGLWGGTYIRFDLLRSLALAFPEELIREYVDAGGATREQLDAVLAIGDQRLQWASRIRRGYCGWLMTNRQFLNEHQRLFEDWTTEVAVHGIPVMGSVVNSGKARAIEGISVIDVEPAGDLIAFVRAFENFFIRWRLDGMPAPFAPVPLSLHFPVCDLRPMVGHMRRGGTTFYLPDIFPVPSRDELRRMLEESLRAETLTDHLATWTEIVQSDNAARNQIGRYARIFEIQHYLRALYIRHRNSLQKKKTALKQALAAFLSVSVDAVEADLQLIAHSLGPKWYLQKLQ